MIPILYLPAIEYIQFLYQSFLVDKKIYHHFNPEIEMSVTSRKLDLEYFKMYQNCIVYARLGKHEESVDALKQAIRTFIK